MFSRLQWVYCAFLATGFVPAASAQTPVQPQPATPVAVPAAAIVTQIRIPPIDGHERMKWLLIENLGAGSLADDVAVGAVDTFFNTPKEYKPHWMGFGERTGMVTANYGVKSVMEAGLGSLWGEDPRYYRTEGLSVKSRMAYVIKMTFMAKDRAGKTMPAYSRYLAMPGSSFLSNEWQPTSQATVNEALVRVGFGFLSRMGENAWKEFIVPRH